MFRASNILKVHLPYHESDPVLNIAYNILCTDLSRTEHLDRRDAAGVQFLFGLDAMRKLKAWFALLLPERGRWKELSTLR